MDDRGGKGGKCGGRMEKGQEIYKADPPPNPPATNILIPPSP